MGILKDTAVGYSTHYMQLRPEIYPPASPSFPPPNVFAPERWEHWQPRPWTYIPFNGGPRICVGQQFALTEMGYTVVRILQRFQRVEAGRVEELTKPDAPWPAEKEVKAGVRLVNGWARGRAGQPLDEPGLVEKAVESNSMRMRSEIVLQPKEKVLLSFYGLQDDDLKS